MIHNGSITPHGMTQGNGRGQIIPISHPLAPCGLAELLQQRQDGSVLARAVDADGSPLSYQGQPIYIAIAPAAMPAMPQPWQGYGQMQQWQGYAPMQQWQQSPAPMQMYAPPPPQAPANSEPVQHEHYHYHDGRGAAEALLIGTALAGMFCFALLALGILLAPSKQPAPITIYPQIQQ